MCGNVDAEFQNRIIDNTLNLHIVARQPHLTRTMRHSWLRASSPLPEGASQIRLVLLFKSSEVHSRPSRLHYTRPFRSPYVFSVPFNLFRLLLSRHEAPVHIPPSGSSPAEHFLLLSLLWKVQSDALIFHSFSPTSNTEIC